MRTTKPPEQLYTSRELAEYSAKKVRDYKHDLDGTMHGRWYNPFSENETITYRVKVGKTRWALRNFFAYPEAEQIARELADSNPVIARMIARMDSDSSSALRQRIAFNRWIEDIHRSVPIVSDGQRKKIYRAEDKLLGQVTCFSKAEAEDFIQSVANSEWWARHSGLGRETIKIKHRSRGKANAHAGTRTIQLSGVWSWDKLVLLHEMAHLLAPVDEYHGPVFAALHVLLVRQFVSGDIADKLQANYRAQVKIATQSTLRSLFAMRTERGYRSVKLEQIKAAKALTLEKPLRTS